MSRDGPARRYVPRPEAPTLVLLFAGICLPGMDANAAISRAGADQIVSPVATVVLDGSQSIADDGSALSFSWQQTSGPTVTLADPAAASTSFVSPAPAAEWLVLTFDLTVTEASGDAATDEVAIVVSESLSPRNLLRIISPPGELVGQGASFEMTFDAAAISITSNAEGIAQIVVSNLPVGTSPLRLTLARRDELPLAVGRYDFAYRNGTLAGKDSLWVHRGLSCGQTVGNFIIHDIGYDDAGAVTRLAVDFKQYCLDFGNAAQPLTGYLRFNSVVPLLSRLPIASAGQDLVVIPGQVVTLTSDTSWPGAPAIASYRWRKTSGPAVAGIPSSAPRVSFVAPNVPATGATFDFELTLTNANGAVSTDPVRVHVQGADERKNYVYVEVEDSGIADWAFGTGAWLFDTNTGRLDMQTFLSGGATFGFILHIRELQNWGVSFTAAAGEQVQAGDYPSTRPSSTQAYPHLSVGGGGRGYNRTFGAVVIHEVEFAADGTITSLAMDFHYKGDSGPRVYGVVRYNSTVEFIAAGSVASAGPDQSAVGGDYVRLGPEGSYVGTTPIVDISWTQIGGPAVQLLAGDDWTVFFDAPPEGGEFVFELTIRMSDGSVSTSRITVTIAPSGTPRSVLVISGDEGEPLVNGRTIFENLEELAVRSGFRPFGLEVLLGALTGTFPTAPDQAYLLLVAPRPEPLVLGNLVPGTYENTRWYRQTHDMVDRPVLSFGVNGLGCLRPRGRFVLHELERTDFDVTRLAVDVQQTCDPAGSFLRAQVRINSAVPIRASQPLATAGHDLIVRAGREYLLDGLGSGSWSDGSPSFSWRQVSGADIAIPQPDSRTALATPAALASGRALATVELEVLDASGSRASDRADITVLGADQPWNEMDIEQVRTSDGTIVRRQQHDPNNAYIVTGARGFRDRWINSYSEHVLGLSLESNIQDQIPTGSMKVTGGAASDIFGFQQARIQIFDIDEFNDFSQCTTGNGAMRVAEAVTATDGFGRLAVDFDLQCPDGHTYRGATRINSAVPVESGRVFASAGPDRSASESGTVMLDGTASLIVHGAIAGYRWRQLSGPAVALTTSSPGVATFTVPQLTANVNMRFELEVAGEQGQTGTDDVTILAEDSAPPPPPPPPPGGGGSGGGGGGALPLGPLAFLYLMTVVGIRRRSERGRR